MKIFHRYILKQLLLNLVISIAVFTFLFLIFDFFDRIDNIITERPSFFTVIQYFALKVPGTVTLMLPIAMLVATLFTIGLLSRNSEMTAMRASGATITWLIRPILLTGLMAALFSIVLNETLVPYTAKRVKEIYNIEIKRKDQTGLYSQANIWWRSKNEFYSVDQFDSRTNTLQGFSKFSISDQFDIMNRTDAKSVTYVDRDLGWTMKDVTRYDVPHGTELSVAESEEKNSPADRLSRGIRVEPIKQLPLPITKTPRDFYDTVTDPETLNYQELKNFMKQQARNGLPIVRYMADLYSKISFPFINFIVCLVVVPFALQPARSGNMAQSILASLAIGFSYYVVNSFAISMGRAELLPPLLAAWTANILMGTIGAVLLIGSESPA